jgi:hypothetical protein
MALIVEGFFLCDAAHDYGGRVSALGAFVNLVQARTLPAVHPIGIVARLAWPYEEVGEGHTVAVEVRHDADNELIARIEGALRPHEPHAPHRDLPVGLNLAVPLQLHLRRPGFYSARLIVDGSEVRDVRRPLKVVSELPVP